MILLDKKILKSNDNNVTLIFLMKVDCAIKNFTCDRARLTRPTDWNMKAAIWKDCAVKVPPVQLSTKRPY